MNTKTKRALSLTRDLLRCRRQSNIRQEQAYHEKLVDLCLKSGWEFETVVEKCTAHLKANDLAAIMQGWV